MAKRRYIEEQSPAHASKRRTPDPIDMDDEDLDAPIVIPAAITHDMRDTRTRRLATLGLALLVVALVGIGLNTVIDTNHRLHTAERERTLLIIDVQTLADNLRRQGVDLTKLRQAIIRQNRILKKAGLTPIPVPHPSEGGGAGNGGQSSTPRSQPSNAPPPSHPSSHPSPHPTNRPTSHPGPSPTPTHGPVICLPVVHCINPVDASRMTVVDWQAILVAAMLEDMQ